MKKEIKRKRETLNNHRSQVQQENSHCPIDKNDKLTQEKVIIDIRQKEREHELLKVNPEDILEEEERRTNPLCLEE